MRWARYQIGKDIRYGVVHQDLTIDEYEGTPFGDHTKTATRHLLADVRLLAPVIPGTFYAVGYNYEAHTKEAEDGGFRKEPPKRPEQPDVGYRTSASIIAHNEPVVIPRDSQGVVQFEGEIVAVIGKTAKYLTRDNALDCLLGYTIGNDISERAWQKSDRTAWRAKNSDTFAPMGPWIETALDTSKLTTTIRLNGKQVSQFDTNNMIFGIVDFLVAISSATTLNPGDVLWMGAEAPSLDMRAGDVVEVDISGIGTLSNPIAPPE